MCSAYGGDLKSRDRDEPCGWRPRNPRAGDDHLGRLRSDCGDVWLRRRPNPGAAVERLRFRFQRACDPDRADQRGARRSRPPAAARQPDRLAAVRQRAGARGSRARNPLRVLRGDQPPRQPARSRMGHPVAGDRLARPLRRPDGDRVRLPRRAPALSALAQGRDRHGHRLPRPRAGLRPASQPLRPALRAGGQTPPLPTPARWSGSGSPSTWGSWGACSPPSSRSAAGCGERGEASACRSSGSPTRRC